MITTDFPVAAACGSIAAVVQSRYIRKQKPNPLTGRVAVVGTAMATWYGLCASTMIIYYPAWMNGYAADPQKLSPWASFFFFVPLMALVGHGTSVVTQTMIEQQRTKLAVGFAAFSLALCGINILVVLDAFTHVGTFAEWCAGTAPQMGSPALAEFQMRYNTGGVLFAAVAIAVVIWLVREARRLGP
jgi:hypothetical protein